ncbi:hypothetical protein [Arthrobacter sp. H14-L1]|nr:hypothetical protein [Arthrobacter sp. H14-L1]MCY0905417.1 hypothetical protein [Arthrobacter sp. H14-L1]
MPVTIGLDGGIYRGGREELEGHPRVDGDRGLFRQIAARLLAVGFRT